MCKESLIHVCFASRFPERSRQLCSASRCRVAIALSYVLPLLACSPPVWVFQVRGTVVHEPGGAVVLYHVGPTDWASHQILMYHLTFLLYSVVLRLVPCVVLTILSFWLVKTLYRSSRRHAALTGGGTRIQRARRTTRMLVAVLLLFLATEFPSGVLGLLTVLLPHNFFDDCYKLFGELLDMLALCNGAINFILYCSMSRQFRTTFSQLFFPEVATKLSSKGEPMVPMAGVPRSSAPDVQSTFV